MISALIRGELFFKAFFLHGFFSPGPSRIGAQQAVRATTIHGMVFGVSVIFFDRDAVRLCDLYLFESGRSFFADTTTVFDFVLICAHGCHSLM